MNVKLLEKVKARILRNGGKRFNMKFWGVSCKDIVIEGQLGKPPCGTQACLAGETVLAAGLGKIDRKHGGIVLKDGSTDQDKIKYRAIEALDLNYGSASRLFYFRSWSSFDTGWPSQFEQAYNEARTPLERAKVAADRIDHFIATGN